jgi:hypothetical protein
MSKQTFRRQLSRALTLAALTTAALARPAGAEPPDDGRFAYAHFGGAGQDVLTTGSLPSASWSAASPLAGFSGLVRAGNILVRDTAPTRCLPDHLTRVVADVAARFGPLSVESTHRTPRRNRRAGGARHSLHLDCRAIDFRVHAPKHKVMAYLRSRPEVGGLKVYRNGIIHIDNGERRSW